MAAALPAAVCFGARRRALLALVLLTGGCVDKAPPPMWPAPPPPRVATPIRADDASAPVVQAPGSLDAVPADASVLDPAGPAAAATPKDSPSPRRVPAHR